MAVHVLRVWTASKGDGPSGARVENICPGYRAEHNRRDVFEQPMGYANEGREGKVHLSILLSYYSAVASPDFRNPALHRDSRNFKGAF